MAPSSAPPPLALWATPRTVSTAFDKMMRTRGDHRVFTEPFSHAWYHGPQRRSPRYGLERPQATFTAVLDEVMAAARDEPVFVKEMPYQLGPLLEVNTLRQFRSTFLVRDPRFALPSLHRQWPDFTDDEAGYDAQLLAYRLLVDEGIDAVVIDSDRLRQNPSTVVGAWCDAMGIPRRDDALRWEPGMPHDWEPWAEWFTNAAASTGFAPPDGRPPPAHDIAPALMDRCVAAYEELADRAL